MHNVENKYFPSAERKTLFDGVVASVFEIGDTARTTIMIVEMSPGARVLSHSHPEHQIGLCLQGSLLVKVGDQTRRIGPLSGAYFARSGILHEAINTGDQPSISIDIKRSPCADERCISTSAADTVFMDRSSTKCLKGGLEVSFFVGPWFEIMVSSLPPGAIMPSHAHRGVQIGVGLEGTYTMEVDGNARAFNAGDVYIAPEYVTHAGWNKGTKGASSLNIFIPPRWNLLPKKLRA